MGALRIATCKRKSRPIPIRWDASGQTGTTLSAMDNERIRAICMALPHVTETVNWGHHLVYWAGDRDIGGKMFAMTDLDGSGTGVLWFHVGHERFHELLETEGMIASPYLAKAGWVTVERWDVL